MLSKFAIFLDFLAISERNFGQLVRIENEGIRKDKMIKKCCFFSFFL
tara:strand:- start:5013 stop:5153 length:141 start_codon:yes stop_codon:yes gene_type:complete